MYLEYIALMIIHWVADFVIQTRQEAKNKSTSNKYLLLHTVKYSLLYISFFPLIGRAVFLFIGITFISHTIIDYFTSRVNKNLWTKREMLKVIDKDLSSRWEHLFWCTIGFDQCLHIIQLIITYTMIENGYFNRFF